MSSYKCSKCEYISGTKGLTVQHIRCVSKCEGAFLVENIIKVKCEICDKEFDTEKLLSIHKKRCVEKKALIISKYKDPTEVETSMLILIKLVKELNDKCTELAETSSKAIKKLEKRLEKLEASNANND